jgi:hypothetical protein
MLQNRTRLHALRKSTRARVDQLTMITLAKVSSDKPTLLTNFLCIRYQAAFLASCVVLNSAPFKIQAITFTLG